MISRTYYWLVLPQIEYIVDGICNEVVGSAASRNSHVRFFLVPRQMAVKEPQPPYLKGGCFNSTY